MGNEESQPGAPGQPQGPGGPMGMGGPGPPRMTGPGPPRGPGPPAGGAGRGTTPRATGPTLGSVVGGGLNTLGGLLAGGGSSQQQQVKPVAQYPAGPDSIPRGRGPGSMGGPVQVGVQPWADPPVQQPQPAFRGAAPPRGQTPQQHQMQTRPTGGIQPPGRQQQPQPIQITAKQQQQAMDELGVDLSNLSEEEKHKILSVMLKAHDMEEDLQRHKRAKDDGVGAEQRRAQLLCPACRAVDLAVETNKMCGDCGKNFCQKCGTFVPGEGRRSVWVCNGCSISRKEHSAAMATTQQQQESSSNATTYSTAGGQKMMDQSRREDAMSREYEHHLHPDSSVDDVVSISPTTESADTTTYYMIEEEDISDIRDLNGNGFAARSSRIRSMLEEELEDDEDEEDDMEYVVDRVVLDLDDLEEEEDLAEDEKLMQSASTTTMLQAIPYYDRSPGEVYTIPEEEEDMMSPQNNAAWKVSADCSELNSDTASSLLRWRGVGQTFQQPGQQPQLQPQLQLQQPQQQQQQQPVQMGVSFQPGNATPIMGGVMQTDHQSTSLIGGASVTTSSTTGFASGSLLQGVSVVPTSVGGVGSGGVKAGGSLVGAIPRTVPLMSLSQSLQQPDLTQQQMQWQQNQQLQPQQQTPQMQQQWGMQPGQSQLTPQTLQQQQPQLQSSPKLKPKGIELASGSLGQQPQKLKASQKAKDQQQQQLQSSEWSPVSDLSPIMDVSPSLEAAEQEMMEKCQGDPTRPSIPRATSGTISGMLADFNKALGLATTPVDEAPRGTSSLLGSQIGHQTLGPPQATVPLGTVTMASTATANTSVVVTDVDQNQNMVNQQFQLQQQQMMIQQQQQMIQQQQQQLQQQAQIQQIQIHHQQMQPQTLQQQQQFQQQQQQFPQQQFQPQQQMQQQQTQLQPQQPLQQPQMSTVGQPGIIMGAQTQTQQARKVHRRLPQPTTEQMQAAVAIAAQTPRSKPRPLGGPTPSLQRPVSPMMPPRKGTDTQLRYGGVGLSGNGATGQALLGAPTVVTSLSTTPISPTPQQRMESDTTSESESGKAGKIRRRLPPVPLDQEPTPIPRRTSSKDRTRTLSMGATPLSYSDRSWDRRTPHRTTSLDGGMSLTNALTTLTSTSAAGFDYSSLFLPTSTSSISSAVDNYLQYLTTSASQLTGALSSQASVLAGISSSLGIGPTSVTSMLGRRDLSAPHSLSSYLRSAPASYLLDHPLSAIDRHHPLSTSLDSATMVGGGSKLPSYMMSLKHQLREELRSVSEDRRRITDPDLSGLLSHSTWPLSAQDSVGGYDHLRKGPALSLGSTGRPTAPPGSPRRNRHRRHASDTKLALYSSPLARDEFLDEPVSSRFKHQTQFGGLPFKSFEFESIDDHLRRGMGGSGGLLGGSAYRAEGSLLPRGAAAYRRFDMDPRLASQFGGGTTPKTPEQIRRYNRQMARLRRHTDTGLTGLSSLSQLGLGLDPYGRSSSAYATYGGSSGFYGGPFGGVVVGGRRRGRGGGGMVPVVPGRKPSRSWHPSPYVSEDEEEDQRTEEKKAKIKAEIARRRQQIEERLHDELYKLARVRDGTDRGYVVSPAYSLGGGGGDRLYTSPISLESGSSPRSQGSDALSVLHSIDDILRKDTFHYRRGEQPLSYYTTAPSSSAYATDHRQHRSQQRYDRYYDPYYDSVDDRGVVDHYESMDPYDPMLEYGSPMITPTETTPAMPLLPDMPTRSRKILEDLGSSPIVSTTSTSSPRHHHQRSSTRSAQPYDDYIDHRGVDDRASRHPPHHQQQSQRHQPVDRPDAVPPGNRSRKPQNSKAFQKYEFPVKRILLTRDPKDRSVSGNGLGMKVVGGKEIPGSNGMIGAYVARIYPGGVVETLGEVREGDQVLEWNGVQLTGKTYEEVQRIIASSGDEVEIVIRSDFNMLSSRSSSHHHQNDRHHHQQNRQQQQHHSQSSSSRLREGPTEGGSGGGNSRVSHSRSNYQQQQQHQDGGSYNTRSSDSRYNRNYDSADFLQSPVDEEVHNSNYNTYRDSERNTYSSPTRGYNSRTPHIGKRSPPPKGDYSESNKEKYRAENISGEIQLQVCYDSKATILYVTIVRARNLVTSRDNSGLPDPFVKCYLLPDRCVENERRTRYFSRCSDPEWKQTMVYPNVPQDQLKKKYLEISVYNYDINRPSEFLGEVILDLKDNSVIDEQSRWYKLHPHDPKKYPGGGNAVTCTTLNNESSTKMARLNNPGQKALYFDTGEDIRKFNNSEKQFFKQLIKKPTATDNYTKASEQPAMADTYIAHWKPDGPSLVTTRVPRRHLYCPLRIQTQNPITQTLNLPMGPVISVK